MAKIQSNDRFGINTSLAPVSSRILCCSASNRIESPCSVDRRLSQLRLSDNTVHFIVTLYYFSSRDRYFSNGATIRDCIISLLRRTLHTSSRVSRWTSNSSVASRCCSDVFSTPVARKQCVRFVIVPGFAERTISFFHSPPA